MAPRRAAGGGLRRIESPAGGRSSCRPATTRSSSSPAESRITGTVMGPPPMRREQIRPSTTSAAQSALEDPGVRPSHPELRLPLQPGERAPGTARVGRPRRPDLVSMKKGRVSSGGRCLWVGGPRVGRRCGAVLMSLWPPRREDQAKLDASLVGACPKRAVRPPDEKWRLWERTAGCGKACARSRG